jgi:hypothetical protein
MSNAHSIMHFTHINNLPGILAAGFLQADGLVDRLSALKVEAADLSARRSAVSKNLAGSRNSKPLPRLPHCDGDSNRWLITRIISHLFGDLSSRWEDTFYADKHADVKADFILANPPFNMSDWARKTDDKRWHYGVPPLVTCMIALPSQLFRTVQIPACLWFFAKDKGPQGAKHIDRNCGRIKGSFYRQDIVYQRVSSREPRNCGKHCCRSLCPGRFACGTRIKW